MQSLSELGISATLHIENEDHFSILERLSNEDPAYALQQVLIDFLTQK